MIPLIVPAQSEPVSKTNVILIIIVHVAMANIEVNKPCMISYNSQYRVRCSLVPRTLGNKAKLGATHLSIVQGNLRKDHIYTSVLPTVRMSST